jgi:lysophospholipase L1-like esterase
VGRGFDWSKRPGTKRVLSLGDSVTYGLWECIPSGFCHGTPYPVALELLWKRTGRGAVEVIDGGVYGYSSLQGLRYYRTYLGSLDADIVTVMFGWNDHGHRTGSEGREPRNVVLRAIAQGAAHLATYRTLAGVAALALMRDPEPSRPSEIGSHEPRVSLDDFSFHLEQLVQLARERGAQVLLITQPVGPEPAPGGPQPWLLWAIPSYDAWDALHDRYNDRVREIGQDLGVPVVDADAEFDRRNKAPLFSPYDLVHPNDAGHALIAELVADRMVREGWLSRPGR